MASLLFTKAFCCRDAPFSEGTSCVLQDPVWLFKYVGMEDTNVGQVPR